MLHDGRADVPHLRNLTLRRSIIPENDREFRIYATSRFAVPSFQKMTESSALTTSRFAVPSFQKMTESSALTQSSITQRTLYTIIILTT